MTILASLLPVLCVCLSVGMIIKVAGCSDMGMIIKVAGCSSRWGAISQGSTGHPLMAKSAPEPCS